MASPTPKTQPWYKVLYIQVLVAVAVGIAVGYFRPKLGLELKPLGDGFINLVKMIIAPIVFCTVVHGIASMGDLKRLGRLGVKALIYFEVVSTFALVIGLVVVNLWKPGAGMHINPALLDQSSVSGYVEKSHHLKHAVEFFLDIIPRSFFSAFASGEILQILLIAILSGFAISGMGERGKPILHALGYAETVFFRIMNIIVYAAPLAALGAMSYTIGASGIRALGPLCSLMAAFCVASVLFVVGVLGVIAWFAGFSIFGFLKYIKEEIFLVLGTSSSETALTAMLEKMQRLGCAESTVRFVIPTGYSFNLDGTNIYMTMAAVFLAQATDTPLSLGQQLILLAVAMLSSKGATGVTGAGFVVLAATMASVESIPMQSLALLVGIDRFMSTARALVNLIGNGVATVMVSRWEGEVTPAQLRMALAKPISMLDRSAELEGAVPEKAPVAEDLSVR